MNHKNEQNLVSQTVHLNKKNCSTDRLEYLPM